MVELQNVNVWYLMGIGAIFVFLFVYFLIRTNRNRKKEVDELNHHFPERKEQPISLEKRKKKSAQPNMKRQQQREDAPGVAENLSDERIEIKEDQEKKPPQYRRSIFDSSHFYEKKQNGKETPINKKNDIGDGAGDD